MGPLQAQPELVDDGRLPFEDSLLESRWRPQEARAFLELLRDFARAADFAGFLEQQAPLYALAEGRMRRLIDEEVELDWFEGFFGAAPEASFHVLIGLGNGPGNYGPKFRDAAGAEQLYAVLGTWLLDGDGQPVFNDSVVSTVVHEFNHSFVNHHVYAHREELRAAGERLFPLVAQQMRRQAYGSWPTMLHESLVRAAVVRYQREHRGEVAEAMEIALQEQRGFLWMGELAALLGEYEAARDRYPDFGAFFPRLIEFFDGLAPRIEERMAARDAARPRLLSATPANGAREVDPATTELVFRFDRPMKRDGYSVMLGPGGREAFPEVSGASFDEPGEVFTLEVALAPDREYRFGLNTSGGSAFQARDGTPLAPVEFSFRTSSRRGR